MQLTINISNEQLFEKILWLLNSFKNDGLEIIANSGDKLTTTSKPKQNGLDFSSFQIESFKNIPRPHFPSGNAYKNLI